MKNTSQKRPKKRMLISVSVPGSSGPFRLLVNEDDTVGRVIDSALKLYSRMGRLPVLRSEPDRFFICYQDLAGCYVALGAHDAIGGSTGVRSFVLAPKKPDDRLASPETENRGGTGVKWKSWLHKSLSFKNLTSRLLNDHLCL